MAGIWEEFRWKRGDLAGFAGLVVVGRILLVAGGLAGVAGLAGMGIWEEFLWKRGGLAGFAGLAGDNSTGKGMSSPALPAARALSLAAGPLQDK